MSALWVVDLAEYDPLKEGHWPKHTAGFNLSLSGRIWLSDNRPINIATPEREGVMHPCHRDLIDGIGDDQTNYSGVYCWVRGKASLWLYPHAEAVFTSVMLNGLKSLIGVHHITADTKVFSNVWRHEISSLSGNALHLRGKL